MKGSLASVYTWSRPMPDDQVAIIAQGFYENFDNPWSGLTAYYDIEEGDGTATRDMTKQQSSAALYGTSWREANPAEANWRLLYISAPSPPTPPTSPPRPPSPPPLPVSSSSSR
jgi:hypothetical protein